MIMRALFVFAVIIGFVFFFVTTIDCVSGVNVYDKGQCSVFFSRYLVVIVFTGILVFISTVRRQRKRALDAQKILELEMKKS